MEDQIPTTPAPTAGVRTSEGAAALITISAPVVAALAKLEGWQLIAALGIAAIVAIAYGGFRTWLKAKGVAALVVLALLTLAPGCGHAAQAARGTFATLAAAEHSYSKWATSEVDRLVAQAKADCPREVDRAACVERITGPTFRNLEITDAALMSYHEAQRAASICLAKGGDVAACTTASAGAAGKLLEQLGGLGFEVRQ